MQKPPNVQTAVPTGGLDDEQVAFLIEQLDASLLAGNTIVKNRSANADTVIAQTRLFVNMVEDVRDWINSATDRLPF